MSRQTRSSTALLFLLALSAAAASALEWEQPRIPPSARAPALGGLHAALTDDVFTIFNNPAGLVSFPRRVQLSEVTLGLSGPIFDMTGIAIRAYYGEDVDTLRADPDVQKLLSGLHAGLAVSGPAAFAYAGGGLGFGFYDWLDVAFDSASSAAITTAVRENLLVTGGYALRVPIPSSLGGTLDAGGMLKTIIKGESRATQDLVSTVALFGDPGSLLSSEPFVMSLGVGIDLGLLYRRGDLLAVGLVARDAFTPTRRTLYASYQDFVSSAEPVSVSNARVRPDLSLGVRYSPRILSLERVASRFKFLLDYNDILDFAIDPATARNPILHVSLGAEAVVLDILSLRAGVGDGLLSAGLALDLAFVEVSLSMFGTELSQEPGLRPTYNMVLSARFSL